MGIDSKFFQKKISKKKTGLSKTTKNQKKKKSSRGGQAAKVIKSSRGGQAAKVIIFQIQLEREAYIAGSNSARDVYGYE